jgi:hypothetical protein
VKIKLFIILSLLQIDRRDKDIYLDR